MSSKQVSVQVETLSHFRGALPVYQTSGAAGLDVCAMLSEPLVLQPGERALVPTGLSVAVPLGYELQARPRSGLAIKHGISLVNSPGTIDSDYRGEIKLILINHGTSSFVIQPLDRVAQLVLAPVVQLQWEQVEKLDDTERGRGGFGSTGLKAEAGAAEL